MLGVVGGCLTPSGSLARAIYISTYVETYAPSAFAPAAGQFTRGSRPQSASGLLETSGHSRNRDVLHRRCVRIQLWPLCCEDTDGRRLAPPLLTEIRQTISLRPRQREHTVFVDHHFVEIEMAVPRMSHQENTAFSTTVPPTLRFVL